MLSPERRVITVIEVQRIVVLGSTVLFTMVWQLRIHDDRYEGWDNFLFVETEEQEPKAGFKPTTYSMDQ